MVVVTKVRGHDRFYVSFVVKNVGTVSIPSLLIDVVAKSKSTDFSMTLASDTISLVTGESKRITVIKDIPPDFPTGFADCIISIHDGVRKTLKVDYAWDIQPVIINGSIVYIHAKQFYFPSNKAYGAVYIKNTGNVTATFAIEAFFYDSYGIYIPDQGLTSYVTLNPGETDNRAFTITLPSLRMDYMYFKARLWYNNKKLDEKQVRFWYDTTD